MPFIKFKHIKLTGKPKSFLLKLFIQISIVSVILILFISYILYRNYIKESTDIISLYNQKLLSQTCNNFEFMDNYIKTLAINTNSNNKAKYLMSWNDDDQLTRNQYINDINEITYNIPFVNSIYLYDGRQSLFFCISNYTMIRSKSDMFDKGVCDIIENISSVKPLSPIARIAPYSGYEEMKKVDTYTYVLPTFETNTNEASQAVFINVNAQWLFDNLNSAAKKQFGEGSNMIVIDKSGTVYGHSQENQFVTNISNLNYIKRILNSKDSSGFFRYEVNNVSSVINYQYLTGSDLFFIITTPNGHIVDFAKKIKLTSGIVCSIAVFLALFLSYMLSLNFYTPVKNLYKNVKGFLSSTESSPDQFEKKNEFDFISKTITHMSDKMNTLETFKSTNLEIVKNQYLTKLLLGSLDNNETITEKFTQYNININLNFKFMLIVFRLDHYSEFLNSYSALQQFELKQQFCDILYEKLHSFASFECVNLENDQIIALVSLNESISSIKSIIPIIEEIHTTSLEKLSLSVSSAISDPTVNIANLHTIYLNTLDLLQYRLSYGHSCVLTAEILDIVKMENIVFNSNLVKDLIDSLKNEDRENVIKHHKDFFSYLAPYSPQSIRYGLEYLTVNLFDVLHVIENNSTVMFDVNFMDFNNRINGLETLEEISRSYISFYEQIMLKIDKNRENKSDMIINSVKKYINLNYIDRNLSLNSVAEAVNMSPVYLGKLFKNTVFKSVSEYINEVRIKKAVELMQSSNNTIEGILEKVGWESKKYFFTVFKKYYGVTPNEFRLANNIKSLSK
jgi:two-component system, response regulator YesN